jgi:type IV secretory pathway ATPase VirB11/archaellum biosynthesis ATPase
MSDFPPDDKTNPRDSRRLPRLVEGRRGTRLYSIAALAERVLDEFAAEHGTDSSALHEADTPAKRYRLILDAANYVLAVESVALTADEKAELVNRAYSELFGYGPLDALFVDERVTTIALKGADRAAVRYGHGELVSAGPLFDDEEHLHRIITRLLEDAKTQYREDLGIIETGLRVGDRPVALNLVLPPYTPELNADIRLHPAQPPSLDDLVAGEFMTEEAAALIRQIAASAYGLVIVGESETGKTTLLNALALLQPVEGLTAVERAGELQLAAGVARLRAQWSADHQAGISFGDQILSALSRQPTCLLLDEVRADEPYTIAPLLEMEKPPRQIWTVRGAPDAKRLQSALGMLARRASRGSGEELVHALYERLPFVLTVARIKERLQLFSIAEWQSRIDTDYPDYVMLFQYREGAARPTRKNLARWLDI